MTTPDEQSEGLDDQGESERGTLSERVAMLQNRVKALGFAETLSGADLKAFMDDQWGEDDQSRAIRKLMRMIHFRSKLAAPVRFAHSHVQGGHASRAKILHSLRTVQMTATRKQAQLGASILMVTFRNRTLISCERERTP